MKKYIPLIGIILVGIVGLIFTFIFGSWLNFIGNIMMLICLSCIFLISKPILEEFYIYGTDKYKNQDRTWFEHNKNSNSFCFDYCRLYGSKRKVKKTPRTKMRVVIIAIFSCQIVMSLFLIINTFNIRKNFPILDYNGNIIYSDAGYMETTDIGSLLSFFGSAIMIAIVWFFIYTTWVYVDKHRLTNNISKTALSDRYFVGGEYDIFSYIKCFYVDPGIIGLRSRDRTEFNEYDTYDPITISKNLNGDYQVYGGDKTTHTSVRKIKANKLYQYFGRTYKRFESKKNIIEHMKSNLPKLRKPEDQSDYYYYHRSTSGSEYQDLKSYSINLDFLDFFLDKYKKQYKVET